MASRGILLFRCIYRPQNRCYGVLRENAQNNEDGINGVEAYQSAETQAKAWLVLCAFDNHKIIRQSISSEIEFIDTQRITTVLYRKFTAAYGEQPPSVVKFGLLGKSKKVVTRVNGIWVTAYHARLHITADPLVTAFLYETGLGAKNSQGFGMFSELSR